MVAIHETAYPRLRSRTTFDDLDGSIWEPKPDEMNWVNGQVKKPLHRQVLLLMLKMFQHLGYHTGFDDLPSGYIQYYGEMTKSRSSDAEVRKHRDSSARSTYLNLLRDRFKVKPAGKNITIQLAYESAKSKHHLADIVNEVLENLIKDSYELPPFDALARIASDQRRRVNKELYSKYLATLDEKSRQVLSSLLDQEAWEKLKKEPGKLATKNTTNTLAVLSWLRKQQAGLPNLPDITPDKHRDLQLEACALDRSEMARLRKGKQELLLTILLRYRLSRTLDDAADLLIKLMRRMHTRADKKLKDWLKNKTKQQEQLIGQLKDVTVAYQGSSRDDQHRLQNIGTALKHNPQEVIDSCDQLLTYSSNNYLPFLLPMFKNHRANLFDALSLLKVRTPHNDYELIKAILFIKKHQTSRKTHIDVSNSPVSLKWIPARKWWTSVTGTNKKGEPVTKVHRLYLELCLFTLVAEALRSGDLFVEDSENYSDFRTQFISEEEYQEQFEDFCQMMGYPSNGADFCRQLKAKLYAVCKKADEQFPDNTEVQIINKKLSITPIKAEKPTPEQEALASLIKERMPPRNILDVLSETEKWLNLSKHIRPLSGNRSRIDNVEERFVLNLLCYGCNLGPVQLSRSVQNISRKQIARLNLKHCSEDTLIKCIRDVINGYNQFSLPAYWGTGKRASADGTKWDVYENNLLSEYHIRYGGYGGIAYYHLSDKYICLFSRFIPCGVYEAIYILDGLLQNDSDIQPDTVHSDTHGQSLAVFGLAYLLGIKLMPRIKNIKRLNLHRPEAGARFKHINGIFAEPIDYKVIEREFPEMLRIAMSIKAGKLTASTIVRRLTGKSRKNQLYYGFRELGRVIRTQFLMEYIADGGLRRMINASTNKSEHFNKFSDWVFFYNKGVIRENDRHEQDKIIKWNHLATNMLIFYNVEVMTRVLKELREEGHKITEDDLKHLSPYIESANRLGDYRLELGKQVRPLDFSISVL